ncbi:MAG: serpin family protein [Phycisphaerales bacterium]|nr:serpin family protein [Phycisphaerales bacterium]
MGTSARMWAMEVGVLALCAGLACCGARAEAEPDANPPAREAPMGEDDPALRASALAGNDFAFELLRRSAPAGQNAVLSPLSVRHAMALAMVGAEGRTLEELAAGLGMERDEEEAHAALASMVAHAISTNPRVRENRPEVSFASRIWLQDGYALADGYESRVGAAYGAAFQTIDFGAGPDRARRQVNAWIEDQTHDRIRDLLPQGSVTDLTRLILSNAVYLNATWSRQFEAEDTRDGAFTLADGTQVQTPMMHQTAWFRHRVARGYEAVQMGYVGTDLAMLVVMPTRGSLEAFEASMDAAAWSEIVDGLGGGEVILTMPKFEQEQMADVGASLRAMGMERAFTTDAEFGRMVSHEPVSIGGVFHGAFIRVDEAGTEAAAATALMMVGSAAPGEYVPPPRITIDKPFLFAIADTSTGAIVFLGRVVDPR